MGYAENCRSAICVGWAEDIGRRDEMEDGFVFVDCFAGRKNSAYFAIYDGHGGRQCVDYVTQNLHDNLLVELQSQKVADVPNAFIRAFSTTDRNMQSSGINTSGCTACCCLLQEEKATRSIYTAHLGDARAVICRGGLAVRLTSMSDHKATDPAEAKRVIEAGGTIFNERVNGMLAISRAFGDHQLKAPALPNDVVSNTPDITSTELTDQDMFVIVACDGLWDVVEDQESVNLVLEGIRELMQLLPNVGQDNLTHRRSMAEVLARMLVEEALARGTSDNVTCLMVFP
jgi:serine/threonine protein phosphatase PrpC